MLGPGAQQYVLIVTHAGHECHDARDAKKQVIEQKCLPDGTLSSVIVRMTLIDIPWSVPHTHSVLLVHFHPDADSDMAATLRFPSRRRALGFLSCK
jgi:hypothetical protein